MGPAFDELIQLGRSPQEAAAAMRELISEPQILIMIGHLTESSEGREILEEWAGSWARYGLSAPWLELLETSTLDTQTALLKPVSGPES